MKVKTALKAGKPVELRMRIDPSKLPAWVPTIDSQLVGKNSIGRTKR